MNVHRLLIWKIHKHIYIMNTQAYEHLWTPKHTRYEYTHKAHSHTIWYFISQFIFLNPTRNLSISYNWLLFSVGKIPFFQCSKNGNSTYQEINYFQIKCKQRTKYPKWENFTNIFIISKLSLSLPSSYCLCCEAKVPFFLMANSEYLYLLSSSIHFSNCQVCKKIILKCIY